MSAVAASVTNVAKVAKLPYCVPSMAEINARPYSGLTAVSTFSGGGGSSLGYRMAGIRVRWASEFIEAARETYRANFPDTIIDARDIREVTPESILAATKLRAGELDIFDGSPPCAAFSAAGKGAKGWGHERHYSDGAQQRVDDLFYEYARLVEGLQPKVFIAENVKGLVRGVAIGYFKLILQRLKDCGYNVEARVINAAWLGVPQARERLVFIGVRNDLDAPPAFPKPLPYSYTVREALAGLSGGVETELSMVRYSVGAEWRKLRQGHGSERYINLVRAHYDAPCPTISANAGNVSAASVAHPAECRKFSVAETRRLCSFPDDFVLTGNPRQQIERMGRAVPPVMMAAIAQTVSKTIFAKAA
ncbi:DNA cytosine methyltransferase [Paraburkholderia mimosarum]|uniref:DNA cytosine methyltransferase n=1 Tax=Paraburkholderia mimosarum TaxID=312026 RepID=UPI0003F698A8|nr:DNA cytosine methyltransferase [Paraburkholderia mimosarum]